MSHGKSSKSGLAGYCLDCELLPKEVMDQSGEL